MNRFLLFGAALALSHCAPSTTKPSAQQPKTTASSSAAPASTWHAAGAQGLAQLERGKYIAFKKEEGSFPLFDGQVVPPIVVSQGQPPGVQRVARDLAADLHRVTQRTPELLSALPSEASAVVLLGTLESPWVEKLQSTGKLDTEAIRGRWETHLIQVVEKPFPTVQRALVVVGSDVRGAIYGAYDISSQIGVSPWYFWDDVPTARRSQLYVRRGRYSQGEPVVKYRGFFINDEEPQLGRWARAHFGPAPNEKYSYTFNHKLYARVYEVLLRLKGNYLWPAVWARSLFDDDPRNQSLAAEYGIVMGTSHEAPMMRAQHEWDRYGAADGPYGGNGAFSFVRNQAALEPYWADGLRRMNGYESLITVGMRGNGDTGMEDAAGTELMGRIVNTQRSIIEKVLGKPANQVPQVWTLYKEVQDYWAAGMRAPDDVTIIWCDDNWGNLRGLPDRSEPMRSGGFGLYYHFDYVGGGRNYKWVDTTLIPNMWEQLHLAYHYGVDRVWVTNVGDLKNNEHPLEFFLDYAWNPSRYPAESIPTWEQDWAAEHFGPKQADAIARLVSEYGRLASLRKPELLNRKITLNPELDLRDDQQVGEAVVYTDESPFSLVSYREAEQLVERWQKLAGAAEHLRAAMQPALADAFYQLVYYPIAATANVYELRLAAFQNQLYATQKRAATNSRADQAEAFFAKDQAMSLYYNTELAGGKWTDWQTQPKLAYGGPYPNSSWQQPQDESGAAVADFIWPELVRIQVPPKAEMAVALDGSSEIWPDSKENAILPRFSPYQTQPTQYLEVVNRGSKPFAFRVQSPHPWLKAVPESGSVEEQQRVELQVDFASAPSGTSTVPIEVHDDSDHTIVVTAIVENPNGQPSSGFVEANGVISILANHYQRSTSEQGRHWQLIEDIGRLSDGMTPFPVTSRFVELSEDSARLEYDFHAFTTGKVKVWAYLSPRNNVLPQKELRYAISIDNEAPQMVKTISELNSKVPNRSWERNTSDNVARLSSEHLIDQSGSHVLKLWAVDPTVIVQKLVIDFGGMQESYLGPPESFHIASATRVSER